MPEASSSPILAAIRAVLIFSASARPVMPAGSSLYLPSFTVSHFAFVQSSIKFGCMARVVAIPIASSSPILTAIIASLIFLAFTRPVRPSSVRMYVSSFSWIQFALVQSLR